MNKRQKLIEKIKNVIRPVVLEQMDEGGLGGHMAHVHEDQDLTFGEIKAIMYQASKGKLESTTEKLDGQNIFFSYESDSGLRFARNRTDIKTGGMDADAIETKWSDKPTVARAFGQAYKILSAAVAALPETTRKDIFMEGRIWYSAEILGTINPNVINYDQDVVVFHESGYAYDENGNALDIDLSKNFATLIANVNHMQEAIKETGWKVMGPVLVPLQKLANNEPLEVGINSIEQFMNEWNMSNDETLNNAFEIYLIDQYLKDITADEETKQYIAELTSDFEKTPASKKPILKDLIKEGLLVQENFKYIVDLFENGPVIYTNFVEPVRDIIRDFAIAILNGVQSYLILNPNKEVQRLKDQVAKSIDTIKATRTEREIEIMHKELSRLKSLDNITNAMEGIAFKYKGKVYKFTGTFAPINQILAIEKYGR